MACAGSRRAGDDGLSAILADAAQRLTSTATPSPSASLEPAAGATTIINDAGRKLLNQLPRAEAEVIGAGPAR